MGKRTHYVMVAEDDPKWARFWDRFPRHESKKDARRVWLKLNPTQELADRIDEALEWQVPYHRWDGEKRQFCPLPATYLGQARWDDERPPSVRARERSETMSTANWTCPHVEHCSHPRMCEIKNFNPAKYPVNKMADRVEQ